LRRAELRVGLCPDRLVLPDSVNPITGDAASELKKFAAGKRIAVVLSNHFIRYALLHGSNVLKSEQDWAGYAQHQFASTYGSAASAWRIRLCSTGRNGPRLACATEAALLESLRTIPGLVSVQPYLMAAFNSRRRALSKQTAWFVLHERGRLVLCLFIEGVWTRIRARQAEGDWRAGLADSLDREKAALGELQCDRAVVCAEDEVPERVGRYFISDLSVPRRLGADQRPRLMALG
jgi:hypothetical protein